MPRNSHSKSVSFEEYRHKSWHDLCKLLAEDCNNPGASRDRDHGGSGDYLRNQDGNHTYHRSSSFGDAYQDIPPPIVDDDEDDEDNRGSISNRSNYRRLTEYCDRISSTAEELVKKIPPPSMSIPPSHPFLHRSHSSPHNPEYEESRVNRYQQRQAQKRANELNNNYIMPSSLGQIFTHSQPSPPQQSPNSSLLPPPTPYKDQPSSSPAVCNFEPFDIIEIKPPPSFFLTQPNKESDIALVPQTTSCTNSKQLPFPINPKASSAPLLPHPATSNSSQNQPYLSSRREIFNLPDVYSPPPLRPPQNYQTSIIKPTSKDSSGSLRSYDLHQHEPERIMPSFMHSPVFHQQQQQRQWQTLQQSSSPRLTNSEPLKSSKEENGTSHNSQLPPPPLMSSSAPMRTPRYPIIIAPKRFDTDAGTGGAKITSNSSSNVIEPNSLKGKLLFCQAFNNTAGGTGVGGGPSTPGEGFNRRTLHYEHQTDPHLLSGNGKSEIISVGMSSRTEADHHQQQQSSNNSSKHNCLSPRAKVNPNPFIQPSVLTPSMSENILMESLANLKSPHWEDNFDAFSQVYNLTEIHPHKVRTLLNKIIWHGLPHLSSPRSKLVRMGCICFKQLFQTQKRYMEVEGEKVFYRLLDLCGGLANNFIQQESREALIAAVENMDPLKSILFIELHGAKHKNPHVREFSAYLLTTIMDELPQNRLMNKDFSPRIIPMIVSFLREGLLQTRLHGKLALDKVFDHPTFESKLRRYVSPENVRHIAETLREFRERRSGHI